MCGKSARRKDPDFLKKFQTWYLPVSLEIASVCDSIFSIISESMFVSDKDEYEKSYRSLTSQDCLHMEGICNFTACNGKLLENTTYTSSPFFLCKDTFFYVFFAQHSWIKTLFLTIVATTNFK